MLINTDAARRAIAWAKANPDKIAAGDLAQTDKGESTHTMDPEATCFCLVGRIAREMGVKTKSTADANDLLVAGETADTKHRFWEANDAGVFGDDPLRGFNMLEKELNDADA